MALICNFYTHCSVTIIIAHPYKNRNYYIKSLYVINNKKILSFKTSNFNGNRKTYVKNDILIIQYISNFTDESQY